MGYNARVTWFCTTKRGIYRFCGASMAEERSGSTSSITPDGVENEFDNKIAVFRSAISHRVVRVIVELIACC